MNTRRVASVSIACRCSPRTGLALAAAAALAVASTVRAQATDNVAPRISWAGVSEAVRADTLCVTLETGSLLTFPAVSVADADLATATMHARVELEPAVPGTSSVLIPGLAELPGVVIVRLASDRIRFDAPLVSVNAAFAALRYESAAPGDTIDLIADDLQLPPLSAELRLLIDARSAPTPLDVVRCRPPPDLRPESDTGQSDSDDITHAPVLLFDVGGLAPGDQVQLLNDDVPVAEGVAAGATMVISDTAPMVGLTGLYAVSVNAGVGSAAWSVAVVSPRIFADGFEAGATPP